MEQSISKLLGQVIRDLRIEAGISQVELGERSGIYQTYLSRLENGLANPTVNALDVISETLGVTIFDLFALAKANRQNKSPSAAKRLSRHKPAQQALNQDR